MTFLKLENAAALLENKIKNKHSGVTAPTLETFCMKVTRVCLSCHLEEHCTSPHSLYACFNMVICSVILFPSFV